MRSIDALGISVPTSLSTSRCNGVFGREASSMPSMPPIEVPTQLISVAPAAVTRAISAVMSFMYCG